MKKNAVFTVVALTLLSAPTFAFEARIFVKDKCIVTGTPPQPLESGAIAAAFLANVAGTLVSTGMDALAKALGEEVVTTMKATARGGNWYVAGSDGGVKLNQEIGCLIAVVAEDMRGTGSPIDDKALKQFEAELEGLQKDEQEHLRLAGYAKELAQLGLSRAPAFYLEAKFATTKIAPVFALEPTLVHYPGFMGGKPWLSKNQRDVVIGFEFSTVDGDFASTLLTFEGLKEGQLNTKKITSSVLPWISMPPTEGVKMVNDKALPFNVRMTITETAKPGVLGKALSSATTASKDAVKEAVETKVKLAVSASERQAARNAATASANTALSAYFDAYAEWKAAEDALAAVAIGDAKAKAKAKLVLDIRKSMLDNAQSAAKDAMENAGIPFTPISTS